MVWPVLEMFRARTRRSWTLSQTTRSRRILRTAVGFLLWSPRRTTRPLCARRQPRTSMPSRSIRWTARQTLTQTFQLERFSRSTALTPTACRRHQRRAPRPLCRRVATLSLLATPCTGRLQTSCSASARAFMGSPSTHPSGNSSSLIQESRSPNQERSIPLMREMPPTGTKQRLSMWRTPNIPRLERPSPFGTLFRPILCSLELEVSA
mmetsp:Transcript_28963/g.112680  ORF Transcript_28963/g.112680 Transcript_28963/m.112680 type:complete len:208 (+) Transcript_28963:340-963(+)